MPGSGKRSRTPRDTAAMGSPTQSAGEPAPPMAPAPGPNIRALTGAECEALLDRHSVGRIAYAMGRHVDIVPIHYVRDGSWLYGRTSPGGKVDAWQHSHWIAFEVDEVRDMFDWASVVVHGGLYILSPAGPDTDDELVEHATRVLRRLIPDTAKTGDPVPWRSVIFRIHLDEVQGRTAEPLR